MMDAQRILQGAAVEPREVEALLLQHPHVEEAVVLAPDAGSPEQYLVAYVAADLDRVKALAQHGSGRADTGIVDRWNKLYELTYSTGPAAPTFIGWNSSYTRLPLPETEMQEWLQTSLTRIRSLKPRKVLEIGCGVGLVLQHLAPQCPMYVGTDFSHSALEQLKQWIARREDLQHVELLHRSAPDLQDMRSGTFDTIVLNSVVQYFPDIEYLLAVLREAARLLTPDGNIFIGDVRHLGLLPTFHSAVQLSRADDCISVRELKRRSIRAEMQETELVLDPRFFETLPGHLSGIRGAEVQLRRGHAHNELTRYRYDAVLRGCEQVGQRGASESLDMTVAIGSGAEAETAIRDRRWPAVRLISIPNLRLATDVASRKLIATSDMQLTASVLRRSVKSLEFEGVDPEKVWEWGRASDYDVSVGWGSPESPECFEALLLDGIRAIRAAPAAVMAGDCGSWSRYANDPQENSAVRHLILQLREYLKERLPELQIPCSWTVLKKLPRTATGTVDRHAL